MEEVNFGKIIKNSWQITWSNRRLWWFGLIVALTSMRGGNFAFSPEDGSADKNSDIEKIPGFFFQHERLLIAIAFLALLLLIIFALANALGRASLILAIENAKKDKAELFSKTIKRGRFFLWRIISLKIIASLFIFGCILLFFIPALFLIMVNHSSLIIAAMIFIWGLMLFIPIASMVGLLSNYAHLYVVLSDISLLESIKNSYITLKDNIKNSLIMLIMMGIVEVAGVLSILVAGIVIELAIFAPIGIVLFLILGKVGAVFIAVIGAISFVALALFLSSIMSVFKQTAWIIFLESIASPKDPENKELAKQVIPQPEKA